jgi:prolipoprotein diacylglyceryl transferase
VTTTLLASFPSPSQGVWHLGPIPIRAYALCILVGVIVALFIGDRRWAARGGERGTVFDIALWAIIFGLIGGRLYHVLTDWETYFGPGGAGLWAAFKIQEGGLGIWGAVALGGVGAWIGCRRRGIPLPAFGDAIAPGIILAQAIGRIGNYFNQELFGRDTTLPWGLEIFERVDPNGSINYLNGVSTGRVVQVVHPTFLYELIWNLLVFALLIWMDRRFRIGHGRLFALYVAAYCFGRFWIELMRSDLATHIAGIRINSFVSVFVFIGAVVYIMLAPKGREDPSELRGDAAGVSAQESPAEEVAKELAAVAATTGVVAAAKVAGDKEDEDEESAEAEAEAAPEDTDKAEDTDQAEAEGEAEAEPVAEAEQLAEDVAEAPAEDIAAAEAFAEAGEEADKADDAEEDADEADEDGGIGAVEGEEAAESEQAAPEVHEAAVESAEQAAATADEVAEEAADEPERSESEPEPEDTGEGTDEEFPESADDAEDNSEVFGGVGAVEGDEVVEAEEAAPEVHEAAVESAEEAAAEADENAEEAADEGEGDAEQPAEEQVAEPQVHEAAGEGAEQAAEVADGVPTEGAGRTRRRFGFLRRRRI